MQLPLLAALVLTVACSGEAGEAAPEQTSGSDTVETSSDSETTVAATDSTSESTDRPREYLECGCGCCGDGGDREPRCVSDAQLDEIIASDAQAGQDPGCALRGCALGQPYRVCE